MNLLLLAPTIQEDVLRLEVLPGREPISERDLRRVPASLVWEEQMVAWREVSPAPARKMRSLDFSGKIEG